MEYMIVIRRTSVIACFRTRLQEQSKDCFLFKKKENPTLSEHTYSTNHEPEWENSKIITICMHQSVLLRNPILRF